MKNNVIDFYKDVLESMGIVVDENGYIKIDAGNNKLVDLPANGMPMVLPTKENIENMYKTDENGEVKQKLVLFNPLNEDVIKGDTISLKKLKILVENLLSRSICGLGELLLILASNEKLQKKTPLELIKYLKSLSDNNVNASKTKKLVDDKSIDTWNKLYAKTTELSTAPKVSKIFLKKAGSYKGVKYNRIAVLSLPIYKELKVATTETKISGYHLRAKDIINFKTTYEFIFSNLDGVSLDDNGTISIGSNDNESPGFISLMKLFITVAERINKLARPLKSIDESSVDLITFDLKITKKDVENVNVFSRELATIPGEADTSVRTPTKQPPLASIIPNKSTNNPILERAMAGNQPQQVQQQQVQQQMPQQQLPQQQVVQPQQVYPQGTQQEQNISTEQRLLQSMGYVPQQQMYGGYQQQMQQQQFMPQQQMSVMQQMKMQQSQPYQQQPMAQQPYYYG